MDRPEPESGTAGSQEARSRRVSQGSPGEYMMDGQKTLVSSDERSTASCARALARKNRVREWWLAPMAEKKRKRRAPAASAARTRRRVATALSSSIERRG